MMKRYFLKIFTLFILSLLFINESKASHATAVDLKYEHVSGDTYKISLTFYRDCAGIPVSSSQSIDISSSCSGGASLILNMDAPVEEVSPTCPALAANTTCNGGTFPGIEQYSYSGNYTFPSQCADWKISFTECVRNAMVTNIVGGCIYIEAMLNNTNGYNDNSPVLTTIPVIYSCNNQLYNFNHGGYDPDGDSLVYTMVNALTTGGTSIAYVAPSTPTYPVVDTRGFNVFDPQNGSIDFIPSGLQVAVMTMKVEEYRNGVLIGSTMRDMQLIVINCTNQQPSSTTGMINQTGGVQIDANSIEACPGETISYDISFSDPDLGDSLFVTSNLSTIIPDATFTYSGSNPITIHFTWTPDGTNTGFYPYTFTIKDNSCPINVSQVYGFDIKVLPGTFAGDDDTYCPGGIQPILHATGGNTFNWVALSGDSIITGTNFSCNPCANPIPTPLVTTTYEVTSDLLAACKNKDTVVIRNEIDFNYFTTPNDTIVCSSNTLLQLNANVTSAGDYSYNWLPFINLNNDTIANPFVSPDSTQSYQIIIKNDSTGCRMTDTIEIQVNQSLDSILIVGDTIMCFGDTINLEVMAFNQNVVSCDYNSENISFSPEMGGGWTNEPITSSCDDCNSNQLPIGFDFDFYCNTYSGLYVSSNGFVSFNSISGSNFNNDMIPDNSQPNNIIAMCWDDLNPSSGGNIEYKTTGSAGNKIFHLNFNNVSHFGSGVFTGQLKLFEADNSIEIHITQQTDNGSHTLGIENIDGTVGLSPIGYNNTNWVVNNVAIRFFTNSSFNPITTSASFIWNNGALLSDSLINNPNAFPGSSSNFTVSVIDSSCFNSLLTDSISIFVEDYPVFTASISDSVICLGETITLSMSGTGDAILWSTGNTNTLFTILPSTSSTYYIDVTNSNLCTITDTIVSVVNPKPIPSILGDDFVCKNVNLTLTGQGIGNYFWDTGETSSQISIAIDTITTYKLIVTNQFDCIDSTYKTVSVYPFPFADIMGDSAICFGESVNLIGEGNNVFFYNWGNADSSKHLLTTPKNDTTVILITTDSNFCIASDTHLITVYSNPNVFITGDTIAYYNEQLTLKGNGALDYWWNTDEYKNEIIIETLENSYYYLVGTDENGCEASDTIFIKVLDDIIVPNIITPNNDGVNENFTILGLKGEWDLKVFNRWGKLVYETQDYDNNWSGEGLSDGVYYYNLSYTKDSSSAGLKGWLEIRR